MPIADMDRRARPKVRECEGHPAIAPEGRPEQREERLVLVDGQQLPVAERPPFRSEREAHDANLAEERLRHGGTSLSSCLTGQGGHYVPLTAEAQASSSTGRALPAIER